MQSWRADVDSEYAFFFEDDIEASPFYFRYMLVALHRLLFDQKAVRGGQSHRARRLIGVSLNTIRFNEIVRPLSPWTPETVLGGWDLQQKRRRPLQYLHQLPNSWGALYFPWIWRDFVKYHRWRKSINDDLLPRIVPNSATNDWRRSWKRYLVEYVYFNGLYMHHPTLPDQASFSTHHREQGEHTNAAAEDPLLDRLEQRVSAKFTVPLVTDRHLADRAVVHMDDVRSLPIVSFHFDLVLDSYSLAQRGYASRRIAEARGWQSAIYDREESSCPLCILDSISFPVGEPPKAQDCTTALAGSPRQFLIYEPSGSILEQLDQLQSAVSLSAALDRTLIIPPLIAEHSSEDEASLGHLPLETIADVSALEREMAERGVLSVALHLYEGATWVDRIVEVRKEDEVAGPFDSAAAFEESDGFLTAYGFVVGNQVELVRLNMWLNHTQMAPSLATCKDRLLAFRNVERIPAAAGEEGERSSSALERGSVIHLSARLAAISDSLVERMGSGSTCLVLCDYSPLLECPSAASPHSLHEEGAVQPPLTVRRPSSCAALTAAYEALQELGAITALYVTSFEATVLPEHVRAVLADQLLGGVAPLTGQDVGDMLYASSEGDDQALGRMQLIPPDELIALVQRYICARAVGFIVLNEGHAHRTTSHGSIAGLCKKSSHK